MKSTVARVIPPTRLQPLVQPLGGGSPNLLSSRRCATDPRHREALAGRSADPLPRSSAHEPCSPLPRPSSAARALSGRIIRASPQHHAPRWLGLPSAGRRRSRVIPTAPLFSSTSGLLWHECISWTLTLGSEAGCGRRNGRGSESVNGRCRSGCASLRRRPAWGSGRFACSPS